MIAKACVIFRSKTAPDYDIIIPCHRHGDAFRIISYILRCCDIDHFRTEQGFLTEKGEFLDRYEAYDEAVHCGQIADKRKSNEAKELFSEDLW